MNVKRYILAGVLLLCQGFVMPFDALAQQEPDVRTLVIRDGKVFVDGRQLSPQALPQGLDVQNIRAEFRVHGEASPVLNIGGQLYALERQRLVALHPGLLGPPAALSRSGDLRQQWFSQGMPRPEAFAPEQFARQIREQMRLAEQNHYLQQVREQNRELFERLSREHQMDAEAWQLAQRVRLAPNDAERRRMESALRDKLGEIFVLKQQNRQEEIKQLESRLAEMRTRLRERENMKAQIIERRLRELSGSLDGALEW